MTIDIVVAFACNSMKRLAVADRDPTTAVFDDLPALEVLRDTGYRRPLDTEQPGEKFLSHIEMTAARLILHR